MRGFAVGVHDDVCIGNLWAIPDILGVEPCAAVCRFEITLFARRFVEFQQVDPFGGESGPEEEASGRRVREIGRRSVDAGRDISVRAAHGFVQVGRVERGPVEVQGVFPGAALFPDIEIPDAAFVIFLPGETHKKRIFALEDVVKCRQFRNRRAGAVELARRVLDALRRVGREKEFLARKHVFQDGVGAFSVNDIVVVQQGNFQRVECRNVLHGARYVGRVGASLLFVDEPAVTAHRVVDDVGDGAVECRDVVVAQVTEGVDALGGALYGVGRVPLAGEKQCAETIGVPCRHFRLCAARNGGEEHRCGFAVGGAECNAEATVLRRGQRVEGEFRGMGHDAAAYAVGGDEGRGHRAAESQRGVAAVGEAALLPDHRLP